jgi:hypothetical protein
VQPLKDFPTFCESQGVHYHIHKSSPLVPILSQTNLIYTNHTISLRSILILFTHLHLGLPSPSGLLPSNFPTNNLYALLFSPIHATCFAHLILNLIILIYLAKSTSYKAPRYAVSSTLITSPSFSANILVTFKADKSHSILLSPGFPGPYQWHIIQQN